MGLKISLKRIINFGFEIFKISNSVIEVVLEKEGEWIEEERE